MYLFTLFPFFLKETSTLISYEVSSLTNVSILYFLSSILTSYTFFNTPTFEHEFCQIYRRTEAHPVFKITKILS